jgi:putative membrane protein
MPLKRPVILALGLLALVCVWTGPLPRIAGHAFFAHMTIHMTVVAVAAPLLAAGIAHTWLDPAPHAPWLFAAIPASILELIVVWAWHAPALHHWARHHPAGFALEQGTFLMTGLLLWLSALGGGGGSGADRGRLGAGIAGLILTSMHMTLLGALLALAPRPLYRHHASIGHLSPLEDQHLGGAIMLLSGGIAYLAGGLVLTGRLLRARARMEQLATGSKTLV